MTPQKKFPGSIRDRVRQYMLNSGGKKITRERMSKALGIDEQEVMHAMSAMIRKGESFIAVERGKSWRLDMREDGTREGDPTNDADVLFGQRTGRKSFAEAAGVKPETVSESLTRTRPGHDRLEADVLNRTSKGSLIFQTDDGVVWIARKIEE